MTQTAPPGPRFMPKLVSVSLMHPHPLNPRQDYGDLDELSGSITEGGLLEPVVIQPDPDRAGHYLILAGERRWRAAVKGGVKTLQASERPDDGEAAALVTFLKENGHRLPLNPMEKAWAVGELKARGKSPAQISKETGFSLPAISESLALLELADEAQEMVRTRELSVPDALAAVRKMRRARRGPGGSPAKSVTVAPEHFGVRHRLADAARARCRGLRHTGRKYGRVACGECWEAVILEGAADGAQYRPGTPGESPTDARLSLCGA